MTDAEIAKLSDRIIRQLEPAIKELVEDIIEDSVCVLLQHLAHELDVFAKMRKNRQI